MPVEVTVWEMKQKAKKKKKSTFYGDAILKVMFFYIY